MHVQIDLIRSWAKKIWRVIFLYGIYEKLSNLPSISFNIEFMAEVAGSQMATKANKNMELQLHLLVGKILYSFS